MVLPCAENPSGHYTTMDLEMVHKIPHTHNLYEFDSKTVYNILHKTLVNHPSYTSMRSFNWAHKVVQRTLTFAYIMWEKPKLDLY